MEARSVEEENFPQIDAAELDEKHKRYEALYSRRLRAKYFSRKAFDGGDLFDQETTVDNEVIKSSRWPSTRSFADPIKYLEDQNQLSSEAETTSTTNRKQTPKRAINVYLKDVILKVMEKYGRRFAALIYLQIAA